MIEKDVRLEKSLRLTAITLVILNTIDALVTYHFLGNGLMEMNPTLLFHFAFMGLYWTMLLKVMVIPTLLIFLMKTLKNKGRLPKVVSLSVLMTLAMIYFAYLLWLWMVI